MSYLYDPGSRRTRVTHPDGYFVQYDYDELNRLTTVKENGTVTLATYTHDVLSRRTDLDYTVNGASTDYGFAVDNNLTDLDHASGGSFNLQYDYTYDRVSQLTELAVSDAAFLHQPAQDKNETYDVNGLNQYTAIAGVSLTYDANGNMTSYDFGAGVHTYTYDAENKLAAAVTPDHVVTYAYDGQGRRASKDVDGTITEYLSDGAEEIAEYDRATGNLLRRYVYGPGVDERIAMVNPDGSRQFYHVNHQRSTVAITDDGGVVIEQFTYNAWGESNDSLTGNPFRYTGRRLDQETGLYYYRARYYSPALGRFLQTDPIGYADGMNMYAYVGNSPVSFGDPSGLSRFLAIGPIDEVNMTVRVVRDSPTNECPSCIATRQINENAEYTEGIQGVPVDSPFVGTGGVGEVGGGRPAGLPGSGRGLAYANDVYGEEIAPNPYGETVQFPTFFVGFLSVRSVINPSAQYSSATTIRVSLLFTYSITLSQNRWTNAQHITGFTQGIGQQLGVGGFGVGGRIELNSFEGPNGEALNRVEAKGTFGVGKRSAPQDPQGGVRDEFTLFESGNFKDPLLEAQKRGGVIPAP